MKELDCLLPAAGYDCIHAQIHVTIWCQIIMTDYELVHRGEESSKVLWRGRSNVDVFNLMTVYGQRGNLRIFNAVIKLQVLDFII